MTPTCTTRLYIHSHFYSHAPSIPMQERARMSLISASRSGAFLSFSLAPSLARPLAVPFPGDSSQQKSPRARDKIRHSGMQPGRETTRSNSPARWRKLSRFVHPRRASASTLIAKEMPNKPLCRPSRLRAGITIAYTRGIYRIARN